VAACRFDFAILGIAAPYIRSARALCRKHDIEYHPIKRVPICAVAGSCSPLFQQADPLPMESLFSHTIVSYGDISEDPSYCLPFSMGIENKVHGNIHVNSSQLFFQLIQESASIGLIAADPEAACLPSKEVRILKVSDCPVDVELSWIRLRRVPLSSIASEFLDSYKSLC
jgi:DNA-binding transcriptional LysR family regulator